MHTPGEGGPAEQMAPTHDFGNLAEKLDLLFRTVPRADSPNELYTSTLVAEELKKHNIDVTPNHIRALRTGRRGNPSFRLLVGLADLFQVPIDYFVDDAVSKDIQESLEALVAIRDTTVQQIMLRAHGVSPESLSSVLSLLEQIRRIEGLDDPDTTDT